MVKKCPKCGTEYPDSDSFCIECGDKLEKVMQKPKPVKTRTVIRTEIPKELEAGVSQVKEALTSAGFKVSQIVVLPQDSFSSGGDFSQHMPRSDLSGDQVSRPQNFFDLTRFGADLSRAEAEISRQYGIRNLHQHVLNQIRIRMDGAKNEARIRLHPPELGEIKIHMVMEDNRLTVRMEVAEQMVRHLLERDLDALKHVLSEAGIDVDGFDIRYREKPFAKNSKRPTVL